MVSIFQFIYSNILAHLHIEYISQMIRYFRACGSYHSFRYRGLLLTRKLLDQGMILIKLKSSHRIFYGRHHDLVKLCHKWPRICSVCRYHNQVIFLFMTYHRVCNKSSTTGTTCRAGTVYPSDAHGLRVTRNVTFLCIILYIVVCPFLLFLLAIVCPSIYIFWLPLWYLQTFLMILKCSLLLSFKEKK
jgi:hypothetical protein